MYAAARRESRVASVVSLVISSLYVRLDRLLPVSSSRIQIDDSQHGLRVLFQQFVDCLLVADDVVRHCQFRPWIGGFHRSKLFLGVRVRVGIIADRDSEATQI